MPGFAPWREAASPRLLPTVDASSQARAQGSAIRLLLHAAWAVSIVLVACLVCSQVFSIPRGISSRAMYNVPIDVTRYLPMALMRSSGGSAAAAAAAGLPASMHPNANNNHSAASHLSEAELESLWSALAFTPVVNVKHEQGKYGNEDLSLPTPPSAAATAEDSSPSSNSSAVSASWLAQPLLAPLEPPQLAHPTHHDILLMMGIVKETIRARITAAEARAGFISAFEGIVPPSGIHRWQVKPPHDQLQGWQHMGAEQLQETAAPSAAGADDDVPLAEQQATTYEEDAAESDEYAASGDAAEEESTEGAHDPATAAADTDAAPPAGEQQQRAQLAQAAAEHLMTYALLLLKGSRRLAPCGSDDDSLPLPVPEVPGGPPGGRLLLAAALQNNEEAMPNLVLQLLLFAVQASPGSLYISIYESGSTDATSYWLDVLRLLLVPLRVPAHIVTGGDLIHRPGQSHVELVASVRNKAIEPFFDTAAAAAAGCALDQPQQQQGNTAAATSGREGAHAAGQQPSSPTSDNTLANEQQLALIRQQQDLLQQQAAQLQQQLQQHQQQQQQQQQQGLATWQPHMLRRLQQWNPKTPSSRPGRRLAHRLAAPRWLPDVFGASVTTTSTTPPVDLSAAAVPAGFSPAASKMSAAAPSVAPSALAPGAAAVTPAVTAAGAGRASASGLASALTEQLMVPAAAQAVLASGQAAATAATVLPPAAAAAAPQSAVPAGPSASAAAAAVVSSSSATNTSLAACYRPDWVIFLDGGMFFCKSDLQRMLLHRQADMACGWSLHMPGSSSSGSSTAGANITSSSSSTSSSMNSTSQALMFNASNVLLTEPFIALGQQQVPGQPGSQELASFPFSSTGVVAAAAGSPSGNQTDANPGPAPPPFAARRRLLQESPLTSEQFLQQQQLLQRQRQELLQQQQELLKQQQLLQQQQELFKQQQLLQHQQDLIKQQQEKNHELLVSQQEHLLDQQPSQQTTQLGGLEGAAELSGPAGNLQEQQQVLLSLASSPSSIQERLTHLVHSAQLAAISQQLEPASLSGPGSTPQQQQTLPGPDGSTTTSSSSTSSQLLATAGSGPLLQQQQQLEEQLQQLQQLRQQQEREEGQDLPEYDYDEEDEPPLQLPAVLERPSATELSLFPFMYSNAAVGRMVNGEPFDVAPYYAAAHPPTVRRLTAGLPVQVYCCWSGIVKLRAEPFRNGLRFRSHQPGECRARDTSLLCDDLHRLNFSRVLVDSGVLVSRQLELAKKLSTNVRHSKRMPYIRRSRWIEVQGGGSAWTMTPQQLRRATYPQVTCCEQEQAEPARDYLSAVAGGSSLLSSSQHSPGNVRQLQRDAGGVAPAPAAQLLPDAGAAAMVAAGGVSPRRLSIDMTMDEWLAAATLPEQAPLLGSWGGQCRRVDVLARNYTRDFLLGSQQL